MLDTLPTMPLFCAPPWTLPPARAKVRTLSLPEGFALGYPTVTPCPGVQQSKGFSVSQYSNINRSHPLTPPKTHRQHNPWGAARPYPDRPCVLQMPPRAARTFPLALLEPACTTEREIGNCWQRFCYLLSSCPWLVLHDRNHRHPNDLPTSGTGKSSLSPGMKKRVESEAEAQEKKKNQGHRAG